MKRGMDREAALRAILEERDRQDRLHGAKNARNTHADWRFVLGEEVGEVDTALLNRDLRGIQKELVQVAASALAWLESAGWG